MTRRSSARGAAGSGSRLSLPSRRRAGAVADVGRRARIRDARAEEAARQARERAWSEVAAAAPGLVAVLAAAVAVAGALMLFAFDQRGRGRARASRRRRGRARRRRRRGPGRGRRAQRAAGARRGAAHACRRRPGGARGAGGAAPRGRRLADRDARARTWAARWTGARTAVMFVTEGPEESGLIDIRDARDRPARPRVRGPRRATSTWWPSAPTDRCWPRAATTAPSTVWDPRTGRAACTASRARTARCGAHPSARTASASPRRTGTSGRSGCSMSRPATPRRRGPPVLRGLTTAFSPDGRRLVDRDLRRGAAWSSMPARAGGCSTSTGEGTTDVDWSPDGRWISRRARTRGAASTTPGPGRVRFTITGHRSDIGRRRTGARRSAAGQRFERRDREGLGRRRRRGATRSCRSACRSRAAGCGSRSPGR